MCAESPRLMPGYMDTGLFFLAVSTQNSHRYDIQQLLIHSLALKYVMEQINALVSDKDTQN